MAPPNSARVGAFGEDNRRYAAMRWRSILTSALVVTGLAVGSALGPLKTHASTFTSGSNTWTYCTTYQGTGGAIPFCYNATLNDNGFYTVTYAGFGSYYVAVQPTGIGYAVHNAGGYPFDIRDAGHHADYLDSGGTINDTTGNEWGFQGASCNQGDSCQAWQTTNNHTVSGTSSTVKYYQRYNTGLETMPSLSAYGNVTMNI